MCVFLASHFEAAAMCVQSARRRNCLEAVLNLLEQHGNNIHELLHHWVIQMFAVKILADNGYSAAMNIQKPTLVLQLLEKWARSGVGGAVELRRWWTTVDEVKIQHLRRSRGTEVRG